jgi:hypothetical protein
VAALLPHLTTPPTTAQRPLATPISNESTRTLALPHAAQPLSLNEIPLQLSDVDQGGQPKPEPIDISSAPNHPGDTTAEHHKHKPPQIATSNHTTPHPTTHKPTIQANPTAQAGVSDELWAPPVTPIPRPASIGTHVFTARYRTIVKLSDRGAERAPAELVAVSASV